MRCAINAALEDAELAYERLKRWHNIDSRKLEDDARLAEVAPEANRQKGTLQLKVQIESPDQFLTPELSARVDFLHE